MIVKKGVSSFAVWGGVKFCDTLAEASSSRACTHVPSSVYLSCRGWQRKRKGFCTRQRASSVPYTQTHVRVRERRPVLKFGECAGTKTEGLTQPLAERQQLEIRAPELTWCRRVLALVRKLWLLSCVCACLSERDRQRYSINSVTSATALRVLACACIHVRMHATDSQDYQEQHKTNQFGKGVGGQGGRPT
jgi:hypothetical protein